MNQKLELTKKAAELNEKLIDLSLLNSDDSVKVFLVENKESIQSLLASNVTDETAGDSEALELELANKNKLLQAKRLEIQKASDSLNNVVSELEKTKTTKFINGDFLILFLVNNFSILLKKKNPSP